jgi:hypothetical protein
MLAWLSGAIDIANSQIYLRSNNAFSPLPNAVWALSGAGISINLGAGGLYTYLFANYNGFGSEVWYIGDLTAIITAPFLGGGLTEWTLFGLGVPGVSDGGMTAMLLGAALGMISIARWFLKFD